MGLHGPRTLNPYVKETDSLLPGALFAATAHPMVPPAMRYFFQLALEIQCNYLPFKENMTFVLVPRWQVAV